MKSRILVSALVVGHWSLGFFSNAQACVGCREPGSETINHESPTVMAGVAFSWSVLFMLVFAFLVVGAMGAYIWHTCQRIERERARS